MSSSSRRNSDFLKDSVTAKLFRNVEGKTADTLLKKNGRGQFDSFVSGAEFRHELMLSCLDAILNYDRGARWLTLGDVWGREAIYVHKHGGHATASSLQDNSIRAAAKWGYIDGYAVQNAERLTYEDDAFDYTFIKEAFHHLTRPYAGVYEMIRVARKAAVLFEPADNLLKSNLAGVNSSLFHNVFMTEFEPCGFQYRVNAFEMVKTAMALNLPAIAFRGWNDPYKDPLPSTVESEYKESLSHLNEMGEAGERHYNLLSTVFIKRHDAEFYRKLRMEKYYVIELKQFTDSSDCT
jgi:ubiquinone/menaquinone biosynthesis C-methylase UbiE